jgi:hypothetical protein
VFKRLVEKFKRKVVSMYKSEQKQTAEKEISATVNDLFAEEPQLGNESCNFARGGITAASSIGKKYLDTSIFTRVNPIRFNRKLYWKKKKSQRKRKWI